MKIQLGAKLRQMRAVKGFTLEQAGRNTGILANTISRYENGTLTPRLDTIEKLCDTYGYKLLMVPKGTKVVK